MHSLSMGSQGGFMDAVKTDPSKFGLIFSVLIFLTLINVALPIHYAQLRRLWNGRVCMGACFWNDV
ncbi:hypothetical protein O166_09450 [Pseudogulbenkiania ferrooxidans EGD-HP2]|uniref:Uncharacterized protein n=1 Tax=Pseudogulbenkiania ferrooxidans EGD-HP2 TaxID=1388764 RepID=A0ABN0N5Q1_9NEIS|nr:hypothetical protein O166_09450 [Pseudogulbenkiania ferrooxidans EGD-HP2]